MIKKQLSLCLRYDGFKSIIFVSNGFEAQFCAFIVEEIFKLRRFRRKFVSAKCEGCSLVVTLKNGSTIIIERFNESCQAKRCNCIVVTRKIADDAMRMRICRSRLVGVPCFIPKIVSWAFPKRRPRYKWITPCEYIIEI